MKSSPTWQQIKKDASRQRILDAALKIFDRKGIRATSMAAVARAAGITRNTIYVHFPSKREIVSTLAAERWETMQAICEEFAVITELSNETVGPWLRKVFDYWEQHSESVKVVLRETGVDVIAKGFSPGAQVDALRGAPSYMWEQRVSPDESARRTFLLLIQLYGVLITFPETPGISERDDLIQTLSDIWVTTLSARAVARENERQLQDH